MEELFDLEKLKTKSESFVGALKLNANQAHVVALKGDLGSGKTTFVQFVARSLGVQEHVTSPTFIIQRVYDLEKQKFQRLVHIDAYRLENAHELGVLGWDELLSDAGNLIFVEWPEKVEELIPKDATNMQFAYVDETRRSIEVLQEDGK